MMDSTVLFQFTAQKLYHTYLCEKAEFVSSIDNLLLLLSFISVIANEALGIQGARGSRPQPEISSFLCSFWGKLPK